MRCLPSKTPYQKEDVKAKFIGQITKDKEEITEVCSICGMRKKSVFYLGDILPTTVTQIGALDTFGDRLISRFGPVNWPPRSCDLTPLDYFLWEYVKSLVYADKPQTLDHLEDNIRRVIADIRPQMLEKVIENWTSRLDYIRASRGSRMPEVMFKM
ncbi:putative LOC100569746 [Trichonephila clavipes]|nr:putative LOC100569746 [Trichonephila clavipes]